MVEEMNSFATFNQKSGMVLLFEGNSRTPLGYGYSGDSEHYNKPDTQSLKNQGVIPRGVYSISPPEKHPTLGEVVMRLTPDAGNEMFGRSGFYIHGDNKDMNHTASQGCIILAREVRVTLAYQNRCKTLIVF